MRESVIQRRDTLSRISTDLEKWINRPRFNRATVAPADELAITSDLVAAWAGARSSVDKIPPGDATLFRFLSVAATQLSRLLRTLETVKLPELDRLLDQVLGAGWNTGELRAELGHLRVARNPGAVQETADLVLWWNAMEQASPEAPPWTNMERAELAALGIHPRPLENLLQRQALSWLRPLCAARRQLLLFLPAQRAGEPLAQHPLISRMRALLDRAPLPIWNVDEWLRDPSQTEFPLRAIPSVQLHRKRRWWQLPEKLLQISQEQESFSSLEKFLYSPYQWVLTYLAKLRAGALGQNLLSCNPRLYGNLLHRLVEDMVNFPPPDGLDWKKANQAEVTKWVKTRWPSLLAQEGALLLLPGKRSENAKLQAEAIAALTDLCQQCQRWQIETARANFAPDPRPFAGGSLNGYIDLVLKNVRGESAVLDLKYGGRNSKNEQLLHGRPLQLAVYGFLLKETAATSFPAGGFYILADRRVITRNSEFFGGAPKIKSKAGHDSLADVWTEFNEVWQWRRKQLDGGWIELTIEGTERTAASPDFPDSTPPLIHWQPAKEPDRYNDFVVLTGFPEDA